MEKGKALRPPVWHCNACHPTRSKCPIYVSQCFELSSSLCTSDLKEISKYTGNWYVSTWHVYECCKRQEIGHGQASIDMCWVGVEEVEFTDGNVRHMPSFDGHCVLARLRVYLCGVMDCDVVDFSTGLLRDMTWYNMVKASRPSLSWRVFSCLYLCTRQIRKGSCVTAWYNYSGYFRVKMPDLSWIVLSDGPSHAHTGAAFSSFCLCTFCTHQIWKAFFVVPKGKRGQTKSSWRGTKASTPVELQYDPVAAFLHQTAAYI